MVRGLLKVPKAARVIGIALAGSLATWAEIISFNPPTYAIGKPIENRDGWVRAPLNEGDSLQYLVESEDNTTGRLHVHTRGQYTLSRAFKPAGRTIEVKWRWRFEDVSDIRFCMGVGTENDLTDPLVKFCLYPNGDLHYTSPNGSMAQTDYDGVPAVWGYLRLHVNTIDGYWFLARSGSPTRTNETLLIDTTALPAANDLPVLGTATILGRLFLRNEEGGPSAGVDIDDLDWQRADTKVWTGLGRDSTFSLAANWLPVGVPDSNDVVVFGSASKRNCVLDRNVTVQNLVLQNDFSGLLRLNGYNLNILGGAEFLGGRVQGKNALIRFRGPNLHPIIGPATDTLPPMALEGPGAMQLFTRTLRVADFKITGGQLDFNGQNLHVIGDLSVQASEGGHAVGLVGLAGRTITVTGAAHLSGTASAKVNLAPEQVWSIAAGTGLQVEYATVGKSKATQSKGIASRSTNAGSNENWQFKQAPELKPMVESITVITGQTAQFKVSVIGAAGDETFTWLRNGKALPGADSTLHVAATLANNGDTYVCEVANSEGKTQSTPTVLKVIFPAPRSTPEPGEFSGTASIRFTSSVPDARIMVSATGVNFVEWINPIETAIDLTLRAYSVLGKEHSDTGTYVFTSNARPQAPQPKANPRGKNFAGDMSLSLSAGDALYAIRYTTDGTTPNDTSTRAQGEIRLNQTTTLSAIATATGYRASTVLKELYLDTAAAAELADPEAMPASGLIDSATLITLKLPANNTGTLWWRLPDSAWAPYIAPGFILAGKTRFQAVVVHGLKRSAVKTFDYAQGLASPTPSYPSQRFRDSLVVSLTAAPGAIIYAAVNRTPSAVDADKYQGPILINNTSFIRTFAVRDQQTSQMSEINYALEPQTPTAHPDARTLLAPGYVTLRTATTKGQIYYTLDGEDPEPANWIPYQDSLRIDSATTLKALTTTGSGTNRLLSAILTVRYDFSGTLPKVTLKPGQTVNLDGLWDLRLAASPSANTGNLTAEIAQPPLNLAGFDGIEAVFEIKGMAAGDTVTASLDTSSGDANSKPLYHLAPGTRKPLRITGDTLWVLPGNGLYFRANDRSYPSIGFAGETVNAERFTVATFTLDDNAAKVDYKIWRTDKPGEITEFKGIDVEAVIRVNLKNPPGALPNLGIRLCVTEAGGSATTCLPQKEGSFHPLKQHTDGFTTPEIWTAGTREKDKWDLIGLPISFDSGLTVAQLRTLNSRDDLALRRFDGLRGETAPLKAEDKLQLGQAYWLASQKPLASARFTAGQVVLGGEGAFTYTLKKGWNAIAAKQLQALPWPISRSQGDLYRRSRLKGLWRNDPEAADGWSKTDTLAPWVGYYVYWKGEVDTTIEFDKAAALPKAAANSAQTSQTWQTGRDWVFTLAQAGKSLEIGAFDGASDGYAFEDEPALPPRSTGSPTLVAMRDGKKLASDFVALKSGEVHAWQVFWRHMPGHALQLAKAELPSGHGLIALSQRRGIGVDLLALNPHQRGDSSLAQAFFDTPAGFEDTLRILAGPLASLQKEWAKLPPRPEQEGIRHLGAGRIAFDLLGNRRVTLRVVDAKGRLEGQARHHLASGTYVLEAPVKSRVLGLKWVLAEIEGESTRLQKAFKLAVTHL